MTWRGAGQSGQAAQRQVEAWQIMPISPIEAGSTQFDLDGFFHIS